MIAPIDLEQTIYPSQADIMTALRILDLLHINLLLEDMGEETQEVAGPQIAGVIVEALIAEGEEINQKKIYLCHYQR
jgi:hypothetical protein